MDLNVNRLSEDDYNTLGALLKERQLLTASHANSPIGCYSLAQKILIQRDRKEAVAFITNKIERLINGARGE